MLDGLQVVAVVPARGGSKSIPRKNIHPLGGRPLLSWSIAAARAVPEIDRILVSTDDDEIASVARTHGAEVHHRPAALATDDALVVDTLRHLIADLRSRDEPIDVLVLLEPTCPLRSPEDIGACLRRLAGGGLDSVATFKPAELHPHRAWRIQSEAASPFLSAVDPWQPRQKLPPAFQLNGAVYAFRADRLPADAAAILFGEMGAVVMPAERSIDIDDYLDFLVAEAVLGARS
jgi:N-acylneuraminate cytidylyltransferase